MEARRELEPARVGPIRWPAVAEWLTEGGHIGQQHGSARRRGRRCGRAGIVARAVVLVDVGPVEDVKTLAEELQYVAILEVKFAGDAYVYGIVGVASIVITRHVGQQAAPTLSEQIESKAAPLRSIRRAERNAGDDEGSLGVGPARLSSEDLAHTEVADQAMGERITFLAERQIPDAAHDQTVALVGGGAGAVLRDVELVEDVEAAKGTFITAAASVASASHILGFGQSIGDVKLEAVGEPLLRLEQEGVIPAQAQRSDHVNCAQSRIGSRQVCTPLAGDRTWEHGNSADDASRIGNAEGRSVRKLIGAREVRRGKIGVI